MYAFCIGRDQTLSFPVESVVDTAASATKASISRFRAVLFFNRLLRVAVAESNRFSRQTIADSPEGWQYESRNVVEGVECGTS